MYHLELRQFPHVSRVFNLTRDDLERQFVRPWVAGVIIEHDDRRWAPERSRLKILEGPELRQDELGMGRGWATAADVLTKLGLADPVLADDLVTAELGAAAPEKITAELVHAGVGVRGLTVEAPSLEDLFVGLTGEGFDVER